MRHNLIISVLLFFLCLLHSPTIIRAGEDMVDSLDTVATGETTLVKPQASYTLAEFEQLSDEEKRLVYFNEPQLLPENFQAEQYHDIMHGTATEQ